jgi:phosphoribosylanthranilate isomerase
MDLTVKICGLADEEMIDVAIDAGADMIGLVLFPRSPRYVAPARAATLAAHARGRAEVVALTVDMDAAATTAVLDNVRPDWLQMHGGESVETVRAARVFGVGLIKAVPVAVRADLDRATQYADVVDRLLLDARPPRGADRPGGHGRIFDWSLLDGFAPRVPHLLSGGLTPDNVGEAVRLTRVVGVDVSSGVETRPGRKDAGLIRAFVAAARAAAGAIPARPLDSVLP